MADQPVALEIARAQQRADGRSFLLVRGISDLPRSFGELAVKVSATQALRSVARDAPAQDCSVLQQSDPSADRDRAGSPGARIVWRCDLDEDTMARMLEDSGSRLELLLASDDGLQQAVTVEIGWLRRRRLATLR